MAKQPLVSVFTPSHDPAFLKDAFESLLDQDFQDWEWIVLLNGGARNNNDIDDILDDPRIRILDADPANDRIVGALKREALTCAQGKYLVELDHDDVLAPTCLSKVVAAFKSNPTASLVYSDFAQINPDGSLNDERWNEAHGWKYRDVVVDGNLYSSPHGMPPLPSNVALIWYAPNHVRAFTRTAYDAVDGYDANRNVMDDGDLMARLYQVGPFVQIPECLYLQRVNLHTIKGKVNTQKDPALNAQIQQDTMAVYNQQIEGLYLAWCKEQDLEVVYLTAENLTDWVIGRKAPGSVGYIAARGFLQMLNPTEIKVFLALSYLVLAHGGMLSTITPSTDGRLAFQDHEYQSYWNENSFWQYVNPAWAKPDTPRFQLTRSFTYANDEFANANRLLLVRADLVAIKEGPRVAGVNLWETLVAENVAHKNVGTALDG